MKYLYYPGCSLEGTAKEYDLSTRAFLSAAGVEIQELEDWTCCGATAAVAVSELLSLALSARNIALAEKSDDPADLLVPCSACYLNLKKAEMIAGSDPDKKDRINEVLSADGLSYSGRVRVRHLLDVVSQDLGASGIAEKVVRPLTGLTVAPYYGCQCLRPYAVFDNPEEPVSMEPLIRAAGAAVFSWTMGGRCCGASNMTTKPHAGIQLVGSILKAAKGADVIATVCPMCQMNLEAYQRHASKEFGEDLRISILYLPQLLGMAMGLTAKDVRLDLNLAITDSFRQKAA
jgi:heterodisulfide reductase subunit B